MNVMVDIETLGTAPGSVILSIGAVLFDNNVITQTFYQVINRQSSEAAGLKTDQATVNWWQQQSEDARQVLHDAYGETTSKQLTHALTDFNNWLAEFGFTSSKPIRCEDFGLWGNGSDFDNVLLVAAFKAACIRPNWKYPMHRCYRTMKMLYPDVPLARRQGVYHNALDDAGTQAEHLQQILRVAGIQLQPSVVQKKSKVTVK